MSESQGIRLSKPLNAFKTLITGAIEASLEPDVDRAADSSVMVAEGNLPPVSMVFSIVDGGKQYASKHREDAEEVHLQLLAVMRSVLLQVTVGCSLF